MILVDTNVLLDVLQDDPAWGDWSQQQLEAAALADRLAINPVIYSEVSVSFNRIEELEAVLSEARLALEQVPREALFLAGKAFLEYRRTRGTVRSVLPDFYVGAHAAVMNWPLLTRDARRYAHYFPTLQLIAPG